MCDRLAAGACGPCSGPGAQRRQSKAGAARGAFSGPGRCYIRRGVVISAPRSFRLSAAPAALLAALPERAADGERLPAIPGVVPGQFDRPEGCLFSPRCQFVFERCRVERPGPASAALGQEWMAKQREVAPT